MNFFLRNKEIIASILLVFLLVPFFMLTTSPVVLAGDSLQSQPWLKGILLMLLSFIINNFAATDKSNQDINVNISEEPVIENSFTKEKEVMGFYVNWLEQGANSYQSLKDNWRNLDMVAPYWYTITPEGKLESRYGGHQYEVDSFSKNRDISILPLINNSQKNNMMLVDPATRKKAVNNIVDLVEKYNYGGINIDFEMLPSWTRDGYTTFIKELSSKLRLNDKLLTISIFPKIDVPLELQGAYDYGALSGYVDRIVIMTYDKHWSSGPAGPIAPINWVEKNIKYALEYIPANKILLGIANYGYDWTGNKQGQDLGEKAALSLAASTGAEVKWHDIYQVPYFFYWDNNGEKHEVWFESSNSMAFKLDLVNKYNLRGIAIWRLGNETDDFWENIENKLRIN